jgi:hypothetical protein
MRLDGLIATLAVSSFLLGAQQPNSAAATLTINGVSGPPYPVVAQVRTNTTAVLALSGAPNVPWLVARSATGLVQPGSLLTPGGIVDLPLAPPPFVPLQGTLGPAGSASIGVVLPQVGVPPAGIALGHQEALQAVIADPASPAGWRLTAATQVTVVQGPVTVDLNLPGNGGASIDLTTWGFSIPFYGVSQTQLWLSMNGYVTFGLQDSDFTPTAAEMNSGPPRVAPFWSFLEQGAGQVRYTIDANPPPGQPKSIKAEWISVRDAYVPGNVHTFSAFLDANGFCQLSYSTVNSVNTSNLLAGIGPGLGLNPQAAKDLSALHFTGYTGAPLENFFEFFPGPSTWYGPSGWIYTFDLYGQTLSFVPGGAGPLPGASSRYYLY